MRHRSFALPATVLWLLCFSGTALVAQNRFMIESVDSPPGVSEMQLSVRVDATQDLLGFSVYFEFPHDDITIREVQIGDAAMPVDPEWADGSIDNDLGRFSYAVVFDFSAPAITKRLAAGSDLEVLRLVVDVARTSPGEILLDLKNVTDTEPRRLNVMTDTDGNSVAPSLSDGTVTIIDLRPAIASFEDNSGPAGSVFFIHGEHFDESGLSVDVCGTAAEHELLGDGRLRVVAPVCGPGPAAVEVCNEFGCDVEPAGFTYPTPPGAPVILEYQSNAGAAGHVFFIVGEELDNPGLSVRVCGAEAQASLLPGGDTIQVVAPPCAQSGPARVEVCTELGCDVDNQGFTYEGPPQGPIFIRGDTNGDGSVDLSDGVATLGFLFLGRQTPGCLDAADANDTQSIDLADAVYTFNFLFTGGADIPPPFDSCGVDPTPDDRTSCLESQSCD